MARTAVLQLCKGLSAQIVCHLLLASCSVCTNAEAAAGCAYGCRSCQLPPLICASAVEPADLKAGCRSRHASPRFTCPAIIYSAAVAAHPPFADDNTHLHRPCAKHAHPCCRCFSLLDRTLSAVLALAASPWVHRGAGLNRLRTNFWQGECLALRAEHCRCPSLFTSPLYLASELEEYRGQGRPCEQPRNNG